MWPDEASPGFMRRAAPSPGARRGKGSSLIPLKMEGVDTTNEDRLTRLKTEAVLHERLPVELMRARSFEHVLSLLLVRVEVPPELRAVLFYPMLKAVGRKVRQSVRAIDTAVRLGDDVVLMLAETPAAGAKRLGEKLSEIVDESEFDVGFDLAQVKPRIHCAVATFPEDGDDPATLLDVLKRRADDESGAEPAPAEADRPQAGATQPEA